MSILPITPYLPKLHKYYLMNGKLSGENIYGHKHRQKPIYVRKLKTIFKFKYMK